MGMVGASCLPSYAYFPWTPEYLLFYGLNCVYSFPVWYLGQDVEFDCIFSYAFHAGSSEHSDCSFVYRFTSLLYGLGTL